MMSLLIIVFTDLFLICPTSDFFFPSVSESALQKYVVPKNSAKLFNLENQGMSAMLFQLSDLDVAGQLERRSLEFSKS